MIKGKSLSQEQELIRLRNSANEQEKDLKDLYSTFEEKLKIQQETLKVFQIKTEKEKEKKFFFYSI